MKINQFSIINAEPQQEQAELQAIHLLKDGDMAISAAKLWQSLLLRMHGGIDSPLTGQEWLHDILATPTVAVDDWLAGNAALTTPVFYRVALQLLNFEPEVDFTLNDPLKFWDQVNLPRRDHDTWSAADVVDAIYLLLNTRGKNGQTLIDSLTSQGFLKWTYQLPVTDKPLFFNGKPLACFDPHEFIREVVYVETDMDTDFDGQADLVKAEIIRPQESNVKKFPAVFTASPYNQGTND